MNIQILKKLCAGLAVAAGLLGGGAANAAIICSGCTYNDQLGNNVNKANVFGTYNPTTGDNGSYVHGGLGFGAFDDWVIFTIAPAGQVQASATFVFSDQITGFNAQIYSVTASTCPAFSTVPLPFPQTGVLLTGICSSVTLAAGPAVYDTGILGQNGNQFTTAFLNLGGTYVMHVGGSSQAPASASNRYEANLITRTSPIPEPGSLALVALALLSAGAVVRRRA